MKIAHSASIRVFCSEEENESEVLSGLKSLLPFDEEKEKITIDRQTALGFADRKILILEATLVKDRHVKAFLENLMHKLPEQQKKLLLRQLESRIDAEGNFFVKFEKETLAKHSELLVTDGGNCYHVRIKMAAYPGTKGNAVKAIRVLFEKNSGY